MRRCYEGIGFGSKWEELMEYWRRDDSTGKTIVRGGGSLHSKVV